MRNSFAGVSSLGHRSRKRERKRQENLAREAEQHAEQQAAQQRAKLREFIGIMSWRKLRL